MKSFVTVSEKKTLVDSIEWLTIIPHIRRQKAYILLFDNIIPTNLLKQKHSEVIIFFMSLESIAFIWEMSTW